MNKHYPSFIITFICAFDDIPIIFALAERYDVMDIILISISRTAVECLCYPYAVFTDYVIHQTNNFTLVFCLPLLFLSGIWFAMYGQYFGNNNATFTALIVLSDLIMKCLTNVLDALITMSNDVKYMNQTLRMKLYGSMIGWVFGALISYIWAPYASFISLAIMSIVTICIFILFEVEVEEKQEGEERVCDEAQETTFLKDVKSMTMCLVLASVVPYTQTLLDLWYIHIVGFEEKQFIIPIVFGCLFYTIATYQDTVSIPQFVLITVMNLMFTHFIQLCITAHIFIGYEDLAYISIASNHGFVLGIKHAKAYQVFSRLKNKEKTVSKAMSWYTTFPVILDIFSKVAIHLLLGLFQVSENNFVNLYKVYFTSLIIASVVCVLMVVFIK